MYNMLLLFSTYTQQKCFHLGAVLVLCEYKMGFLSQSDKDVSSALTLTGVLKIRWSPMSIATSNICMWGHTVIKCSNSCISYYCWMAIAIFLSNVLIK